MTNTAIQMILYCAVLIVLAIPLGRYIGKVMNGEKDSSDQAFLPWKMEFIRF